MAEIQLDDIFTFYILDTIDDQVIQLIIGYRLPAGFTGQIIQMVSFTFDTIQN